VVVGIRHACSYFDGIILPQHSPLQRLLNNHNHAK
jgi:hypothetical protein